MPNQNKIRKRENKITRYIKSIFKKKKYISYPVIFNGTKEKIFSELLAHNFIKHKITSISLTKDYEKYQHEDVFVLLVIFEVFIN